MLGRLASFLALVVCAAGLVASPCAAQDDADGGVGTQINARDLDGRTLGAVPLPVGLVGGDLRFGAQRAHVWEETSSDGAATRRLLLTGDVMLRIGATSLEADRAVLWIGPGKRLAGGEGESESVSREVFGYLEGVHSSESDASVAVRAADLSVQARVVSTQAVSLKADVITRGRPDSPLVLEGELVLREQYRQIAEVDLGSRSRDRRRAPLSADVVQGVTEAISEPDAGPGPIFGDDGVFSFGAGRLVRVAEDKGGALVATGGVDVQFQGAEGRNLVMRAQRGVVYLAADTGAETADVGAGSLSAGQVSAIYLEGDVVASDGDYTVRGPRFLYDVANDKGVIVDGVFYAFDGERGLPLYLRAEAIRQVSDSEFEATGARLTNTAFVRPVLSIGASKITVDRVPSPRGTRSIATAKNITLRGLGVPFGYFPWFRGDPERFPLRAISYNNTSSNGTEIRTRWDLYSLIGVEPIEGSDVSILADALLGRGPGFGVEATHEDGRSESRVFAYGIANDTGQDRLTNGTRIDRQGEFRGLFEASHIATLGSDWRVFAEVVSVSDVNFVDSFFEERAETGREMRTGVTLRRVRPGSLLSFEASAPANEFVVQEYILQTDGYATRRLPEVRYTLSEKDVLPESAPGLLTYRSDTRAGAVGLTLNEQTGGDYGLRGTRRLASFGLVANQTFAQRDRARGLSEDNVLRFDTRNELEADLTGAIEGTDWLRVSPFVTGRFTGYDDQFLGFSPNETERHRLWAGGGVRLGTEFSKTNNSAQSKLLGINRLRHLIEPSLTLWHGATSVDQTELPVFDEEVESLAEGTAVRFGLDQTWQTQRGGPGRWRSVDVLRLDFDLVAASGESERESPIGAWYEPQPELSHLGDFANLAAVWQASTAVAFSGRVVHDNARSRTGLATAGVLLRHTPLLRSSAELRYLGADNSTLANVGAAYELTSKYTLATSTSYDTDIQQFESVVGRIERRVQNVMIGMALRYNNIRSETSASVVFEPIGFDGSDVSRDRRIPGLDD